MQERTSFASFFGADTSPAATLVDRLRVDRVDGESESARMLRLVRERHEAATRIEALELEAHQLRGKLRNRE